MESFSPIVAAHELGHRLRERRDILGLPATEVSRVATCTPQFVSQVENGKKVLRADKLADVAALLEFEAGEVDELLELRSYAVRRGPLAAYNGIFSAQQLRFFGFEAGCESMQSFVGGLVHGLLQTPEYAHAVITAGGAYIRQVEVDRRVQARLLRQQWLTGRNAPTLSVVMDEAAIRQQVGGPTVLAAQLKHLVEQSEALAPRVELRVIPFDVVGHPVLGAPGFHLLGFPSTRLTDLVWLDQVTDMDMIDEPLAVHAYRLAHNAAADAALSPVDSLRLIKETARELE